MVWLVFFWKLFTPVASQQAALVPGDFSDQFVTFGAYQYARLSVGEVPLWNPYNNGGMPFIADTQAAVFYPPRLLTIALAHWNGGWTYHALELEMTFHILAYTISMYILVRRMTLNAPGSQFGATVSALIGGYSGYLTGYPPLQLALLEAGIWLPLALLGVFEATRQRFDSRPLLLTGLALGLSWMAGHPQTSFFLTYLLIAFFAYRVYAGRLPVLVWLGGTGLFGILALGLVAVTILPGAEYLLHTSRAGFNYDDMKHGFPIRDLLQLVVPGVFSQWSPIWVGLGGLSLALTAVKGRMSGATFWGAVAVFALLFSLGGNGPVYPLIYDLVPGLRFFRGQERAAYLVVNSLAILAGLGTVYWMSAPRPNPSRVLVPLGAVVAVLVAIRLAHWDEGISPTSTGLILAALVSAASWAVILWAVKARVRLSPIVVIAVTAELVLFSSSLSTNYVSVQPETTINRNQLIDVVVADSSTPFRVDGARVLRGNWGSFYQVADIQGISPLFLSGPQEIIESGLPDERAWELFAVRYVYSDWEALPIPSEVVARGVDDIGPVNLHRLTAERPYAHLLYDAVVVDSDAAAREVLADRDFNPRTVAVLHADPSIDLPLKPIERYGSTVTYYSPERLLIAVTTPENAILSLAQVDYPGWKAMVDGLQVELVRAYGGLSALFLPAGAHTVELIYDPVTFKVGAVVSILTWLTLIATSVLLVVRSLRRRYA